MTTTERLRREKFMIQRFIEDLDRGVALGFEGVCTERKVGPPKVLETRWSGGMFCKKIFHMTRPGYIFDRLLIGCRLV